MNIGIRTKLIFAFLTLTCIPMLLLSYLSGAHLVQTGEQSVGRIREMGNRNLMAAREIGQTAVEDSVRGLDNKSTEAIELRTVELAMRIADFLYERDSDIRSLALLPPDENRYIDFFNTHRRDVILPGGSPPPPTAPVACQNPDNKTAWRHHPPIRFATESRHLYREITFIDINGQEQYKIDKNGPSDDLKDVSTPDNTFCRAEKYGQALSELEPDEIYVSRVVGAYVHGWLEKGPEGIRVKRQSAYSGKENPGGKPFDGLIRWATPVEDSKGNRIGYVTAALDHVHIMEFTDHVVPTEQRFDAVSDAGNGNYAWMWDDQDQCISHPRDFFICGYDPETGEEVPGWLSQTTYDRFRPDQQSLNEFVDSLPSFDNFSLSKKGSAQQMAAGAISLDCRVLDFAPQCQGWYRITRDGGSGSFRIFWSGLWKLTSQAAIPYYTGIYGKSERGFGFVTLGANVHEFHKAATETRNRLETRFTELDTDIRSAISTTQDLIRNRIRENRQLLTTITIIAAIFIITVAIVISLSITRPIKQLTRSATAMRNGDLDHRVPVSGGDEIGRLSQAFNEMAEAISKIDKMKSEFVTVASHELRTPIHAIMLSITAILQGYSGEVDEEVKEDIQIIHQSVERLMRLVENLLDLSRIEAGKIELAFTLIDLRSLVAQAIHEVEELAEAHNHTILQNLSDTPEIMADQDKIMQVVVNLLSNAIKYNPDGGQIRVGLTHPPGSDEALLTVADNGYGIPEWAQEKVFDKFFQADSILSSKVGGSGLGLGITRGIVKEHFGTIHLASPLPETFDLPCNDKRPGTVFTVSLPVNRAPKSNTDCPPATRRR